MTLDPAQLQIIVSAIQDAGFAVTGAVFALIVAVTWRY